MRFLHVGASLRCAPCAAPRAHAPARPPVRVHALLDAESFADFAANKMGILEPTSTYASGAPREDGAPREGVLATARPRGGFRVRPDLCVMRDAHA
jgi:hypothetical protein